MKQIEYKGTVHQFPDNVTDDQIRTALSGFISPNETGVKAVPKDISLNDAVMPNSLNYLKEHPEEIDQRLPSLGLFKASAQDVGKDIGSIPKGISDYLVGKGKKLLGGEDNGTLAQNIASKGNDFIDRTIRDPSNIMLPFGGELSSGVKALIPAGKSLLGKLVVGGARLATEGSAQGAGAAAVDGQDPLKGAEAGAVLGPVIGGVLHAPGAVASAVRGIGAAAGKLVPGAADELSQLVRGPATPITPNKYGIQLSPSQAAGVTEGVKPALELMAQTNPYLQDIPGALAKNNQSAIPRSIMDQRLTMPNAPGSPGEISPAVVGGRIDEAARTAKAGVSAKFGNAQDQAIYTAPGTESEAMTPLGQRNGVSPQNPVAETPLPTRTAQVTGKNGGKFFARNLAVDEVGSTLKSVGYDDKKGFTGNETVSKNAINWLREQEDLLSNAKNTEDLLAQKRRIGSEIYEGGRGETPLFGNRDHAVLSGFERRIDDHLSQQFEEALRNGQMTNNQYLAAKNLWNAQKVEYSNNRGMLDAVDRGLGISSAKSQPESYFAKIKNIGVDNLAQLRNVAQKSPELKPLYQEMQAGFFDNFIKGSLNPKTMEISPDRLMTNWQGMDPALKKAIIPDQVVSEMNDIVDLVGKSRLNTPYSVNPSGTGKLNAVLGAIKDPRQAVTAMLFRGPLKEYYATGHAPSLESILNVVDKVKSGTQKIAGAAQGIQDFSGLPGLRNLGTRAAVIGAQ